MKNEHNNDILRIIVIVNITIILTIYALYYFHRRDDLPGILIILANISFIVGITYGIKKQLFIKYSLISSFLYFTGILYYVNETDFLIIEIILIIIYSLFYPIVRNKLKRDYYKTEKKIITETSNLFIILGIISTLLAIYTIYFKIDSYLDKKARNESYEKNIIKNNQTWVNEMTYHIDNLSENHYISGEELFEGTNRVSHNFMKVIQIKNSEVVLVKFRTRSYTPIERLIEESYINYDKKDTIVLSIEKLKQTINTEIRDEIYQYQDSLKNEGVFYTVKDIKYIKGPYFSTRDEHGITGSVEDTIFFNFENRNNGANLTKIVNISGNYKWHNKLPMRINGFKLNSRDYNKDAEFNLKVTDLDHRQDFKFKLYFEDTLNNEHIFLVTKGFNNGTYSCRRVFE